MDMHVLAGMALQDFDRDILFFGVRHTRRASSVPMTVPGVPPMTTGAGISMTMAFCWLWF